MSQSIRIAKQINFLKNLLYNKQSDRKQNFKGLGTQIQRRPYFLYSPEFIYMESPKIKNVELDNLTSSS